MFSKINTSYFGSKKTQQDGMYIRQMKEVMNRWHSTMDTTRYGLRSVHSKYNLLVCQIALLLGLDHSKQSKYTRYVPLVRLDVILSNKQIQEIKSCLISNDF